MSDLPLFVAHTSHAKFVLSGAGADSLQLSECTAEIVAGREVILVPSAARNGQDHHAAIKLRRLGAKQVAVVPQTLVREGAVDLIDAIETGPVNLASVAAVSIEHAYSTESKFPTAHAPLADLRSVTLEEFLKLQISVPEPLLSPLFTRQSLSLVYSWRGVGKTWFALACAYAIASGGKFLNWKAPAPRRVLYLDGEMPASALQRRLASIAAGSDAEASPEFFKLVTPDLCGGLVPDLSTIEGQEQVDRLIELIGAEFIVVDNLSCWVRSGVENEAESWRIMAEWLLRHRSAGRAVLLVHHAGKGGAQRGSSKKEDILDLSLDLRRPPGYEPEQGAAFIVEFKKSRHLTGKDAESFEASLEIGEEGAARWSTNVLKETTYERVVELAGLGLNQKEIAEELDIHKSNVSRHWRQAVEAGQIKPRAVHEA